MGIARAGITRLRVCAVLLAWACLADPCAGEPGERILVDTEGKGYLETVGGYRVLHLAGTPEEMGFQHGRLLKKLIARNAEFMFSSEAKDGIKAGPVTVPRAAVGHVLNASFKDRIPKRFITEMRALARGSAQPYWKIHAANLIPELFHCSGFALLGAATAKRKLLHGRVLDYGVGMGLQDTAVLIIQQPEGRIPFVNVSYAGFIGSVTGMNLRQISIGEMGGRGVGRWKGVPMSFLVRMALAQATTLDQAVATFKDNPRTCEYFYVIADGRADSAVGVKATPERVELVHPGRKHPLLPNPVRNTVIMSAGRRYEHLARLVARGYGRFTQASAIRLMDAPVAMKSNLHNALMVPADGVIWVANADSKGQPAWQQTYHRFDIRRLVKTRPGATKGGVRTRVPPTPRQGAR